MIYRENPLVKTWGRAYKVVNDFPVALDLHRAGQRIGSASPFDAGEGLLWEAVVFCGNKVITYGCDANVEIAKAAVEAWA